MFRKWLGTSRWTYNKCIEAKNRKMKLTKKNLRDYTINSKNFKNTQLKWVLETPYDIRDEAMNDLLKALVSDNAKRKNNNDTSYHYFKFRSRKDYNQSIVIRKKFWNAKRGVFGKILSNLKSSEKLPKKLLHDSRLICNKLGHYYICIPKPIQFKCDNQALNCGNGDTVSLDPGVRTFQTCYDVRGNIIEWGKHDMGKIFRLCHYIDDMNSRSTKVNHRTRSHMKQAILRAHNRIRNLVKDMHCNLAKFLCEKYRCIIIPKFETKGMCKRGVRKINSKTARSMCTLSHYSFLQRLRYKSHEYPHCNLIETTEEYTSKTCGSCGYIDRKLGSKKEYKCSLCKVRIDRDANGARNILLKYLTRQHPNKY